MHLSWQPPSPLPLSLPPPSPPPSLLPSLPPSLSPQWLVKQGEDEDTLKEAIDVKNQLLSVEEKYGRLRIITRNPPPGNLVLTPGTVHVGWYYHLARNPPSGVYM